MVLFADFFGLSGFNHQRLPYNRRRWCFVWLFSSRTVQREAGGLGHMATPNLRCPRNSKRRSFHKLQVLPHTPLSQLRCLGRQEEHAVSLDTGQQGGFCLKQNRMLQLAGNLAAAQNLYFLYFHVSSHPCFARLAFCRLRQPDLGLFCSPSPRKIHHA